MYFQFQSPAQIADALQRARPRARWLLCIASVHEADLPGLLEACRERGVSVVGGLFPGLIHQGQHYQTGLVAQPLPPGCPLNVARLGAGGVGWSHPLIPLPQGNPAMCMVLVDACAEGIGRALAELYDHYGNFLPYLGVGAGYPDLHRAPCLFTEAGLFPDALMVLMLPWRGNVQVRHGWRRAWGPFVATRSEGRTLFELDWEPAAQVYLRQLDERVSGADDGALAELGARYPLSFARGGEEDVVRDVLATGPAGEILLAAEIPENSLVHIAVGEPEVLLAAAGVAVADAALPVEADFCFVADCYTRALALGQAFGAELSLPGAGIALRPGVAAEGVLALGEIAANGTRSLEFFNKSFVLAVGQA